MSESLPLFLSECHSWSYIHERRASILVTLVDVPLPPVENQLHYLMEAFAAGFHKGSASTAHRQTGIRPFLREIFDKPHVATIASEKKSRAMVAMPVIDVCPALHQVLDNLTEKHEAIQPDSRDLGSLMVWVAGPR